ncbi:MAG: hypothetical protein QXO15_03970 [Nitrososphaerota archaeon]
MIAIGKGNPVITSFTSYFIEVLGEDYPLMFKPGDAVSLAKLLEDVLENDSLILKALSRINSIRQKFSWDKIAQQHIRLYLSV